MTKKLSIRFVKFECALVAQQLGTKGQFEASENVLIARYGVDFADEAIWILPERTKVGSGIAVKYFNSHVECDIYLKKVIKWISEEQFRVDGKLEIGKECEVSDNGEDWCVRIFAGKLAKQFGEPRHLAAYDDLDNFERYKYVRPIASCVQPKIEGDIYTWETEVAQ